MEKKKKKRQKKKKKKRENMKKKKKKLENVKKKKKKRQKKRRSSPLRYRFIATTGSLLVVWLHPLQFLSASVCGRRPGKQQLMGSGWGGGGGEKY